MQNKRLTTVLSHLDCQHQHSQPIETDYSIESLNTLAKRHNYGQLTKEIISELSSCLADASTQISVDYKLLDVIYSPSGDYINGYAVSEAINKYHSRDRSHFHPIPSPCVIYATSTQEVSNILKVCHKHRIPVHPSGTRTGLEGSSLHIVPGITLDIATKMNKILHLYEDEHLVEVEPGVEKIQLAKYLKERGYFFPIDPGSNACVGGYANTCASGTLSVKYGVFRENCRSMTVVTPQGDVMETRCRAVKTSAGLNLHGLIIGSEGTLCVVTKLLLTILPLPKHTLSARIQFPSSKHVADYVFNLIHRGISQLARAELLNTEMMAGINQYSKTNYPVVPTLFVEFHAQSLSELTACEATAKEIAQQHQSSGYYSTSDEKEMEILWNARKDAFFAAFKLYEQPTAYTLPSGHKQQIAVFVTDVCVPLKHLAHLIDETEKDFAQHKFPAPIAAHVGDGNFHLLVPYDINDSQQVKTMTELNARMVNAAIACGGTSTGEHGIGIGKMPFLVQERGPVAMKMIRDIKHAIDPHCIMNPYKVYTPHICEM